MKVENAVIPPMQQAMAFFGGTENGPFASAVRTFYKHNPK